MSKENPTKYDKYRLKDVEAYREKKREWAKTPEQRKIRNEYMKLWREKNREKHNKQAQESHQRNKHKHIHKVRERHLNNKYGITQADFDSVETSLVYIPIQNESVCDPDEFEEFVLFIGI